MADPRKGASSSDPKEKSLMLDDDIGKDFVSSWKSISMADDDPLDFSFDKISEGKKKTFDFDNLDMNFNLDGEFGKLSPFKVNISDLDFSSPLKKATNSKERSEGNSFKANQEKNDPFNFSFDFNELDTFDLDSSLKKGVTAAKSNQYMGGVSPVLSGSEDAEIHNVSVSDIDVGAFDDNITKIVPVSQGKSNLKDEDHMSNSGNASSRDDDYGVTASTSRNLVDDNITKILPASQGKGNLKDEDLRINSGNASSRGDDFDVTTSTSRNLVTADETRTCPNRTDCGAEETSQEGDLQEEVNNSKPKSQPDPMNLNSESENVIATNRDTISPEQTEVFSPSTKAFADSDENQNCGNSMTLLVDSNCAKPPLDSSAPLHVTPKSISEGTTKLVINCTAEAKNIDESTKSHLDIEENNTETDILNDVPCNASGKEKQNLTLECSPASQSSEEKVDTMTLMKGKRARGIQSKFFSRPDDTSLPLHQLSSAVIPVCCKGSGRTQQSSKTETLGSLGENSMQSGSKVIGRSHGAATELVKEESAMLGCEKNVTSLKNTRSAGTLGGSKLVPNLRQYVKEVTKNKYVLLRQEKTIDGNMLSSEVKNSGSNLKTAKTGVQIPSSSLLMASGKECFQNSRITLVERDKLTTVKVGTIRSDHSNLKTPRIVGANVALSITCKKEINSLKNSEQNVELQGNSALKNDHKIDTSEKQMPSTPSLKRKLVELSDANLVCLKPLKRLSESPGESRNSEEPSEVVKLQVCFDETKSKPNNIFHDKKSGLQSPRELKIKEPKISVCLKEDANVEKAEAYAKQLEDICSMLKKKHEDAKELIVQAIVNNNNLLMLNHPIHEEKIHKVRRFASQLMSKEIQT